MKVRILGAALAFLTLSIFSTMPARASEALVAGASISGDQCLAKAAQVYLDCSAGDSEANTGAIKAVDLLDAWVAAGAPEVEHFEYRGIDNEEYEGTFERDILPLFTSRNIWSEKSRACSSCHFDNGENSYHEMDLSSYAGIMKGGDVLSHPPGVPLFGQDKIGYTNYDWGHSKMRARLRNNRMPPNWPEDLTETNRDGPCMKVTSGIAMVVKKGEDLTYGCDLNAVGLLGTWTKAGAPKSKKFKFGGSQVSFDTSVLPLFTSHGIWFKGSQGCASCHFNNTENSYHEMDLSSYEGIMQGGDVLSKPPGVPLLGQSEIGAKDYDWGHSKMRARMRNNRMPPASTFDITEENRDGPIVARGKRVN